MTRGFSLIEMLVAMSLFVALSMSALAWGQLIYSKNALQCFTDDVKSAVHYASMQSIIKGKTLYLSSLSNTKDWSSGMALYERQKGGGKHLLHQWVWHQPLLKLTWTGFFSENILAFSQDPYKNSLNGHFRIFNPRGREEKILVLNRLGRVKEA